MINSIEIIFYTTKNGRQPFAYWLEKLDAKSKVIIICRLARIRVGNFGDCKPISGAYNLWELRIDFGPGYRIYFGKKERRVIVLLIGGDKSSQNRDISKAKNYWFEYGE